MLVIGSLFLTLSAKGCLTIKRSMVEHLYQSYS